jgi:hypothetical protein
MKKEFFTLLVSLFVLTGCVNKNLEVPPKGSVKKIAKKINKIYEENKNDSIWRVRDSLSVLINSQEEILNSLALTFENSKVKDPILKKRISKEEKQLIYLLEQREATLPRAIY